MWGAEIKSDRVTVRRVVDVSLNASLPLTTTSRNRRAPDQSLNMESRYLASFNSLSMAQKTLLAKGMHICIALTSAHFLINGTGKLQTVSQLLLDKSAELAKRCKTTLKDMESIINLVCKELEQPPLRLRDVADIGEEKFTTGDDAIDQALGCGLRTGMIWDLSGEK